MKRILSAVVVAFLAVGAAAAQTPQFPSGPDIPVNIKPYFLALMLHVAPPSGSDQGKPSDDLMAAHLAYIHKQVDAGKYAIVGPLLDHARIGGIAVVKTATLDEAKQIADADPMVTSGYMTIEIHPIMLEDLSAVKVEYPAK
jgi:uncharacterized protein YciI